MHYGAWVRGIISIVEEILQEEQVILHVGNEGESCLFVVVVVNMDQLNHQRVTFTKTDSAIELQIFEVDISQSRHDCNGNFV